jgi:hypothetical protein
MAIRFGMTIAEMIAQLTKGFRSVAGRNPDGLEKIKIQQEAVQRFKDMNKVVDMEGKAIDTSKGIMGGKQIQDSPEFGEKVRRIYDEAKGPGKGQEMVDALGSPGARRSYETMEAQLGVRLYGDETFDEILEIQRTGKHPRGEPKKVKETEAEIAARMRRENKEAAERIRRKQKETMDDMKEIEDPEDMAEGGRIGYKDGPDQPGRRKFMKIMGGLAALPIVGKFFKGAKVAAPAAQAVKETVQQAPSYFFDLAAKIKILGKESSTARRERMVEVNYKNYTLEEDLVTGDMTIIKRKGDPEFAYEEEIMSLRKGQADEMTKGKTPPDEYEELTVRPDGEGKMKDVEDGIEPESIQEIVEEVGQGGGNLDQRTLEEIARGKLASGGVAMMLGE